MTDADVTFNYLQGIFWANLGLKLINATVSEKEIDMAKEVSERLLEHYIDGLPLSNDEKERIKRERRAENEVLMRGFKDTLKKAGKLVE